MKKDEINHIVNIYNENLNNDNGVDPAIHAIASLSVKELKESVVFMQRQDEESYNRLMDKFKLSDSIEIDREPTQETIDKWLHAQTDIVVASAQRDLLKNDFDKLQDISEKQYGLTKRFMGKMAIAGFTAGSIFGYGLDYSLQKSAINAVRSMGDSQPIHIYNSRPVDIAIDLVGAAAGTLIGLLVGTKLSPRIARRNAIKIVEESKNNNAQ